MKPGMNNSDLLKELRIDRSAPPPAPSRTRAVDRAGHRRRGDRVLALVAWAVFGREDAVEVQTAPVTAIGTGGGNASVLDATGYVVARRMATVSAKITGKVREVLIEEGQRVEAGQIMATLDPIDADAQRELAASQVAAARSQIGSVQAQLVEAEANARRLDGLVQQQLVSKAQYDQAIAQRDALRAQLATAQRNAQVASGGLRIAAQGVDNTDRARAVRRRGDRQGRAAGRDRLAAVRRRRLHPHRHRHHRRHGFARSAKSTSARPTSAACSRRCRSKPCSTPIRTGGSRPR